MALKIGYVPLSGDFQAPGDRRRFCHYAAKKGLRFEVADPECRYDVVVLTQRADLSVWAECPSSSGKIVYDFIDSYLAVPPWDWRGMLRGTAKFIKGESTRWRPNHRQTLEAMCRRADAVICSTEEQGRMIRPLCGRIHQILDFHTMIHGVKTDYSASKPFRLVWEGLPENLTGFAELIAPLRALSRDVPFELNVVTNLNPRGILAALQKRAGLDLVRRGIPGARFFEWSEETLSRVALSSDLAVIPIDRSNPLMMAKPENRLLLFWRLGLPVVTTRTPAYERAMAGASLDMICSTPAEWADSLRTMMTNATVRESAAVKGRCYVERVHCEVELLAKWDAMFDSLR